MKKLLLIPLLLLALSSPAGKITPRPAPYDTTEEYPVGSVVFPTAVAYIEGYGLAFNRDNLAGPKPGSGEAPWVWAVRITVAGSNGYKHESAWLQFKTSYGTACFTVQGGPNQMVTFVRVNSIEEATELGPDYYGYSR